MPATTPGLNIILESLVNSHDQKKKWKRNDRQESTKTLRFFADGMCVYTENPRASTSFVSNKGPDTRSM